MNQILNTPFKSKNRKNLEKRNWFQFQFAFSIVIIFLLILSGVFYLYHLQKKEQFSNALLSNYNIYQLYYNPSSSQNSSSEITNRIFRNYSNT